MFNDFWSSAALTNGLLLILCIILLVGWRARFRIPCKFLKFVVFDNKRWISWIALLAWWGLSIEFFSHLMAALQLYNDTTRASVLHLAFDLMAEKWGGWGSSDSIIPLFILGAFGILFLPYITFLRLKNIRQRWLSGFDP